MRRPTLWLALSATLALTAPARAQAPDPRAHAAARELGAEGIKLYDEHRYAEALDKFQRANKLVPAPTLMIRIGRLLAKSGRLVDAAEMYLAAVRFKNDWTSPAAYAQAQKDAQLERDVLLPRIPMLRVVLSGPRGERVRVSLDGQPLQAELLDTLVPVDPGAHEVRVDRDGLILTQRATVAEGGHARILVKLPPIAGTPSASPTRWRAGIASSFAFGGAGLVAFAINGAVALAQKSDLSGRCPNGLCPPEAFSELDAYNAARVATTVGLVMGGVGLGVGAALLLARPKPAAAVRIEPLLGVGSAGARLRW